MKMTECNPARRLASANGGNNLGVFFKAVKLPKSMGASDGFNAPYVGNYANAIVQYLADGATFIYDSNGDFVPIANAVLSVNGKTGTVEIKMSDLVNDSNFQTADEVADSINNALTNYYTKSEVDAKDTTVMNVALSVRSDLTAEVAAREAADDNLQDQIDAFSTAVDGEAAARQAADAALQTAIDSEATARQTADTGLQAQIDAISASSDVTDIVGTYAELQSYDTSKLRDNDIVKVLQDEDHNNETTYYRWSSSTSSFTLIGEEGPYYTKSQADALLGGKLDKTTTFWGQTESNGAVSGDITLAGGDKVTWGTDNPYILGNAQSSLMLRSGVLDSDTTGQYAQLAVGRTGFVLDHYINGDWERKAKLSGVDDGSATYDAVNYGQLVSYSGLSGAGAPTTTTEAKYVGQFYYDTTNGEYYYCTAVDPTTPFYSWVQLSTGGGGGGTSDGAIHISTADYNYPTSSPASFAVWPADIKTGVYECDEQMTIRPYASGSRTYTAGQRFFVLKTSLTSYFISPIDTSGSPGLSYIPALVSNGATYGNIYQEVGRLLYNQLSSVQSLAIYTGTKTVNSTGAVAIFGQASSAHSIAIGSGNTAVSSNYAIALGSSAAVPANCVASVALGANAKVTRTGEVNVGTGTYTWGYNSTSYRVIGGVHDGVDDHDAVTVQQLRSATSGSTESYTVETTDWTALTGAAPFTFSTTVTATATIGTDTVVELLNDDPVAFANYGFSVASVSGQTVTIYATAQPADSVTLKISYKEAA